MTKDIIKLAREAGFEKVVAIDPDGSKTVTVAPVPELLAFANLVAAAEREEIVTALREALAQEHAMHELARLGQEIEQTKPISNNGAMRDAKLNAGWGSEQQAEPPPEWPLIKNILAEYGLQAISFVADWKAAQRPWVGLTPEEVLDLFDVNNVYGSKWVEFARTVEAKLKERNT